MKKKVIAVLLVVCMCFSLAPIKATAQEDEFVENERQEISGEEDLVNEEDAEGESERAEIDDKEKLVGDKEENIDKKNSKKQVKEGVNESSEATNTESKKNKGNIEKKTVEEKKQWVEYSPDRYGDIYTETALKSGSGTEYEDLVLVPAGERLLLEGYDKYASGSWYKTSYQGKKGYISAEYVKLSYQAYNPVKVGKTTANMYMRSGVGLDYTKKIYIKSGSAITLHGYYRTEGYDWYKITYGGVAGYVSSKYVKRMEDVPTSTVTYDPLRYVDVEKDTIFKKGSGVSAAEIGTVPEGARIYSYGYDRYDEKTAWYKVAYNEVTGYINADDCHLSYQTYDPVRLGKTTANMYMRSGVGLDYTKKIYIKSGSIVTLNGYYRTEGYDWYKIEYGGKTGYVSSKYVLREEAIKEWIEYDPDRYGDVHTETVLKSGSGISYEDLITIPAGERLLLDGYDKYLSGSWYKTTYQGKEGYVSAKNVKLSYQEYNPSKLGQATANMYMRSGVGLDYTKKLYIPYGSVFVLKGYYRVDGYDWYYIEYQGKKGYISSKYVKLDISEWIEYAPDRYGDVYTETVLKSGSGASYEDLLIVPAGERLLLEGYDKYASGSWYKTSYQGKAGYVSAKHVKLSYQEYDTKKSGQITANLYMRSGVGLNYAKKAYIKSGSIVTLYGYYRTEGYDWYYIGYQGKKGYISSKYADIVELTTKLKKITDKSSAMYGKTLKLYYLNGKLVQNLENIVGEKSSYILYVNKAKQMVTAYYKDGSYYVPYKAMICSTGALSSYTPNGTFYTPAKYRWHTLIGPSYGQWCTRINGGVLFHSVFYNSKNNNQTLSVSAYNKLGSPASHGCVRLTAGDAKWIYDNCKLKTKVVVCNKSGYEPLSKPKAYKLSASHKWDPTDPTANYKCKQRGCH